jgi:choline transport protein
VYAAAFIAVLIALLVLGDRVEAREVFTHFEDSNGWGSIGAACFIGAQTPVLILTGSDAVAHLSEETRGASRTVPRVIVLSAVVNYVLGFAMLIAVMYVLGDSETILRTVNALREQPWVRVVLGATGSVAGTVVIAAIIVFICVLAAVNASLVASRVLFAFARDGGLPFGSQVSRVSLSPITPMPVELSFISPIEGTKSLRR